MKKILLSVFAVAALASCVEDLGYDNPISFGAPFVGNTTKAAADPSYGEDGVDLKKFNVYGTVQGTGAGVVNIFKGVEVTGEVGGTWGYKTEYNQYWIPGATYNFAAVVDATVTPDTNGMPEKLTTVAHGNDAVAPYAEGYLKDMLYDKADEIASASANQAAVNFAFEHLLAKAQFVVTSNTEGGYYYNVKNIKIHNFETGEYTISTGKWDKEKEVGEEPVATNKAYSLGNIEKITKANAEGGASGKFVTNATQVLLIPTTTDFQVEFIVELWNDNGDADDVLLREIHYTAETKAACGCTSANAEHMKPITVSTDLVKGYAYNFNLNLTAGSLIQFTVTSNPAWDNGNVNLGL